MTPNTHEVVLAMDFLYIYVIDKRLRYNLFKIVPQKIHPVVKQFTGYPEVIYSPLGRNRTYIYGLEVRSSIH